MKKLTLLLAFVMIAAFSYADEITIAGIAWPSWHDQPMGVDNEVDGGYDTNPWTKPERTAIMAPAGWTPITSIAEFDATWAILGAPNLVGNQTDAAGGTGFFDLNDQGVGTFGASWKAVHDGTNLYVLLKYYTGGNTSAHNFEIMTQPVHTYRHEHTFTSAADSAEHQIAYRNMAYARNIHFGGGKALFAGGNVGAFEASYDIFQDYQPYFTGRWGNNEFGLVSLATTDHFWQVDGNAIKAVLVMPFDGALAYPANPADLDGAWTPLTSGKTISFDVMTGAQGPPDGEGETGNVKYCWASWHNDVYASNYYAGYLKIEGAPAEDITIAGIAWPNWHSQPNGVDNEAEGGFDANPWTQPERVALRAPAEWSPITTVADFDATWDLLGTPNLVANQTVDGGGTGFFDLNDEGVGTFGASWKAVHDGTNLYVLLKYFTGGNTSGHNFEIMTQPVHPLRHEFTFTSAADSAEHQIAYKNMAYARNIHFGGGKAVFAGGNVGAFEASYDIFLDYQPYFTGRWGNNEFGLVSLATADHFWQVDGDAIKAVMVMPFAGALAYPTDPANIDGDWTPVSVGTTISFDVMTGAQGPPDGEGETGDVKYCWASWHNDVYAANYYAGYLVLSTQVVGGTNVDEVDVIASNVPSVYYHQGQIFARGAETVDVEVYSILGARVMTAQNIRSLNVSHLDNGIYLVRVNNQPYAIKIMKY